MHGKGLCMKRKLNAKRLVIHSGGKAYRNKKHNNDIDNNLSITNNIDETKIIEKINITEENTETNNNIEEKIDEDVVIGGFNQNDEQETIVFNAVSENNEQETIAFDAISKDKDEVIEQDINDTIIFKKGFKNKKTKDSEAQPLFIPRKKPRNFVLGIFFTVVKMLLFVLVIGMVSGIGIVVGIAQAYVDTTPSLTLDLIENQEQTSIIYDRNGEVITQFIDRQNRSWATINEIPDMLKNAAVAVEDVRFYKHNGIDYKRLLNAVFGALRNINAGGGSTITQQLIKNRVLSNNEVSYKRKIQEAYLALELEKKYTKDQILEGYLNDIYLGGSNYGVKATAKDLFGKELSELTVRECAMLGGLTQNPSRYDPRKNTYERKDMSRTNERTDTVLRRMYQAGFITKEQYDSALVEEVKILETAQVTQMYDMPYFVEYAVSNVVTHMLRMENLQDNKKNRDDMERKLRTGGYHIYTTVDPEIQNILQNELTTWEGYPKLRDPSQGIKVITNPDGSVDEVIQPQAAAVIMHNESGEVRALVGGRDEPTRKKLYNRAFQGRMEVGSSIKPLSIYAPALDSGASPASILMNFASRIEGYGNEEERGYPTGGLKNPGPTTMREGVKMSLNVVAARTLYEWISPEISTNYLMNMGINPTGIKASGAGLALGTSGISPLEMAGAYATLANDGLYLEPIAYTKVVDSKGNTFLDATEIRTQKQVLKPSSAWLMTDMLKEAVNSGTGTTARIPDMNVAGKTGTNSNYKSVYFAGYTPYYTSSIWIGHDDPNVLLTSGATGQKYASPLWQTYMKKIHEGLENKEISKNTPERLGLVTRTVCAVTGKIATSACRSDPYHRPVTDWFTLDSIPPEECDAHFTVRTCADSGKVATEFCPATRSTSMVEVSQDPMLASIPENLVSSAMPNAVFTSRNNIKYASSSSRYSCKLHTGFIPAIPNEYFSVSQALELVSRASSVLSSYYVEPAQETQIRDLMSSITQLANSGANDSQLQNYCLTLEGILNKVTSTANEPIVIPQETPQENEDAQTPVDIGSNDNDLPFEIPIEWD